MKLYELIVQSCEAGLGLQDPLSGAMPAGHNGPYHDPETPVRNTSHWAILFLKAYDISGDERFLNAARKALGYLCSREARPMGCTFYHRSNPKKDTCNGLIGQAWTCEALAYAGEFLGEQSYIDLAAEVFLIHPFDRPSGIWQRVASDGMHLPFDMTFNHQLWFGAVGTKLADHNEKIREQARRFMDRLPAHLHIYRSGLIYHPLALRSGLKNNIRALKRMLTQSPKDRQVLADKAVGYHLFNLYAFALIRKTLPAHPLWQEQKFLKTLRYSQSDEFLQALPANPYGYPYNPPGFEMAFVMDTFETGDRKEQGAWVRKQIETCWNPETKLMEKHTEDPQTHAARLYEAVRLNNLDF